MAVIDPSRTWAPLEKRLAETTNERHRAALQVVIEHMKGEASPDLDQVMGTLSAEPDYHFWMGGQDVGPKTTEGVHTYYTNFMATRTNVLEFAIDRLVVDDDCVVTEGDMKQLYPGALATAILGVEVEDPDADYLVVYRQVLLWPLDASGKIVGEDSYFAGVRSVTPVAREDLPQSYIDLVHAPAANAH
ncbi:MULTISPECIES: nuclear transport factor 2 family protein [unclassified Mycobacterium]|uniref:nuclear transport factor 2 family protein n=1 Tax=unclassified Mycobacterium TaxID=2642494 RepID=UPI003876F6BB